MEKSRRFRGINKINRVLDMPKEIYTDEPKFVSIGFNELVVSNYKSILEYEENYIKIQTYIGNVNINGMELKLMQMTEDSIKITGNIISMDIERN